MPLSARAAIVVVVHLFITRLAVAQVVITEVMHSPGGSDALWGTVLLLRL